MSDTADNSGTRTGRAGADGSGGGTGSGDGGAGSPGDGDAARTVLVVSAMPIELRRLVRRLHLRPLRVGGLAVRTGHAGTTPVVASVVGVGPAAAREATGRLLDALPVARVLMIGVAGGVSPSLPVPAVMVPERVVDHETGEALQPDHSPGVQPAGTLLTCATISTGVHADQLRADGVDAVDMETAAVGSVCRARGVRWSAYRSISDTLDSGLVDEEILTILRPGGGIDPVGVARLLARRPSSVRRLVRLGRDTTAAVAAVTAAALRDLGG